jgi:hypothetical protein
LTPDRVSRIVKPPDSALDLGDCLSLLCAEVGCLSHLIPLHLAARFEVGKILLILARVHFVSKPF